MPWGPTEVHAGPFDQRELIVLFCLSVSGPLTESQIAYVLRETLQVMSISSFDSVNNVLLESETLQVTCSL